MRELPRLPEVVFALCAALPATAMTVATASAEATATVLEPASASQTEEPGLEVLSGPLAAELPAASAAPSAARATTRVLKPVAYQVLGRSGTAFAVALPDAARSALHAPEANLPVKGFQLLVPGGSAAGAPGGMALDAAGHQDFKVAVVLEVPDNQPKAVYRGRLDVTLAYN
jgi:hypothetical protein